MLLTRAVVFKRSYSVAPNAKSVFEYIRTGEQPAAAPLSIKTVSKTQGGVTLATVDDFGPVSSVAIVVNSGSRNDSADAPGAAHFFKSSLLRNAPGLNVVRATRETELRGNTLFSSVGREHILIGSTFLRDDLVDAVPLLTKQLFNPSFEPYEFLDALPRVIAETETALEDPATQVFEKLHSVAFRNGLGNPVLASPQAADALSRQDLAEFASKYLTPERITIVGTGVSHADLTTVAEKALSGLKLSIDKATTPKSRYFGGEARIDAGPDSVAHYAVAYPGIAYTSAEYPTALVLAGLLNSLKAASTEYTTVSALSSFYSDAGLLGFHVEGKDTEIKTVVSKALSALKKFASTVSAEDLSRAKKVAIIELESSLDREGALEQFAKDAFAHKDIQFFKTLKSIDAVTAADVQKLAKCIVAGKASVVSLGNSAKLPYFDEL